MAARTLELVSDWQFDVVALGLPCRVIAGRPVQEPANLGNGWIAFDYERGLGKPVRIINDAELQALGSYRGGRMLFLGLGTGVGSCLISHNTLISLDAGALMHKNGKPVWYLLNRAARKRIGTKKWLKYWSSRWN
jgi:polyphosphate glucokinase